MADLAKMKMEREAQYEDFIGKLIQTVHQKEDGLAGTSFLWDLASAVAQHLKDRVEGIDRPKSFILINTNTIRLLESALVDINGFARTEEEKDVLVAQFLEKIVNTATGRLEAVLLRQEQDYPEKLFEPSQASSRPPPSPP